MNWKLIFGLSLIGLAMAFITVSWNAPRLEQFIWLLIFLLSAYLIAKNADGRFFLHGFLVSILSCIWETIVHIKLADAYLTHHADKAAICTRMFTESGATVQQSLVLIGVFIGVLSGIVLGLFAVAASRILDTIYK